MERWKNSAELANPLWTSRSARAARFIAPGSRVLDIGCGAMTLERHLPDGCVYLPADLFARDERTRLIDLGRRRYPEGTNADLAVLLGVLEYLTDGDLEALLRWLFAQDLPALISYSITEHRPDRAARARLGWISHLGLAELLAMMRGAGLTATVLETIELGQVLVQLSPPRPVRRVQVVSYYSAKNFGDRLGYQLINGVLPSECEVVHTVWGPDGTVQAEPCDLLIVGTGSSLTPPLCTDALRGAIRNARRTIGIFGTQYRGIYGEAWLEPLIDALDVWYARYREDTRLLPDRYRDKIVHLGDWMIAAFPMARPTVEEILEIGATIQANDVPLDRLIQAIQKYAFVRSGRLHPLLCALTSAREVCYHEQREWPDPTVESGKFRAMLVDIFGEAKPEGSFWAVDREAVRAYKHRVELRMVALAADVRRLLRG